MATTPNLGLHYYGGDVPGSISDNGSQHTAGDRLYLDQAITQLAIAPRHYLPPVAQISTSFGLDFETVGGSLSDGTTYYYRVAAVGLDGFERIASDEISLVMPTLLPVPRAPGLRDAPGGTLPQGLYYYAFTSKTANQESTLSLASTVNVYAGVNQAIYVDAPVDAAEDITLQVWRKKDTDVGFTRLGTVEPAQTYTDDGSIKANSYALDPAYAPPVANRGNATNVAIITLVGDIATAAQDNQIASWRIYRSTISGYYSAQSLVHEVVERDSDDGDPDGPLRTSWTDTGDPLRVGTPQFKDRSLHLTPYAPETVTALPTDVSVYPPNYLLVFGGDLYILRSGEWSRVQGGTTFTTGPTLPDLTVRSDDDLHLQTPRGALFVVSQGQWLPVHTPAPTLLSGQGAPTVDDGYEGDLWLDLSGDAAQLYGPRGVASWPTQAIALGGGGGGGTPVLTSPNGTRYRQVVDDDGNVTTEATLEPGPPAVVSNPVLED